jgi:hypothetical protein
VLHREARVRWRKLWKICDPAELQLPVGIGEYAQSPQVLDLGSHLRVYFSTRSRDQTGKYLSHISFLDLARNMRDVLGVARAPVLPLGELGAFDEHGIFPMNVLPVGERVFGYTCGWSRRPSVSVDTAIGLVRSLDGGETFERLGSGPIMAASLHEPFLVGDAFVKVFNGTFHMWYIFGTAWKRYVENGPPERTYKIAHAVSSDGVSWDRRDGVAIVPDRLGPMECQALPTVMQVGRQYHMYFCFRQPDGFRADRTRGYRIGHATSGDLVSWTRDDDTPGLEPTEGSWDSDMMCYPHAFECDGNFYLLYNGNEFGRRGFGVAVLE